MKTHFQIIIYRAMKKFLKIIFLQKIITFHLGQVKNKVFRFYNPFKTKCWERELTMTVSKTRKVHLPLGSVGLILPHQFWKKKLVSSLLKIWKILGLQIQINLVKMRIYNYNNVLVQIGSTWSFWNKNIKKLKFHQTENIYMNKMKFQISL